MPKSFQVHWKEQEHLEIFQKNLKMIHWGILQDLKNSISQIENNNPNKSLQGSSNFILDGTLLSDPKIAKGSMKIEHFENFPQRTEYEDIQIDYLNSIGSNKSIEKFNALYEDTF